MWNQEESFLLKYIVRCILIEICFMKGNRISAYIQVF